MFSVCKTPPTLRSKSEAMGSGRKLSSENMAQAIALANTSYSQIHIRRVLGCSRCAVQKPGKWYRKDKPVRRHPSVTIILLTEKQLQRCGLYICWWLGIQVSQWPPSSPDMSLIESILAHLMREFSINHPATVRELQVRVQQIWNKNTKGFPGTTIWWNDPSRWCLAESKTIFKKYEFITLSHLQTNLGIVRTILTAQHRFENNILKK